jgi:predicted nuclease of predicted toxin-antitoxin system/uncharacterized protein (DUF433 family)
MSTISEITIDPTRRSGKPCIRDTRIPVYDVLEYLASGMSESEIIADFPELTAADIRNCLVFAADRERRLVGAAWVKLLFDQNLPARIVNSLSDIFPDSLHVKSLGMSATDDRAIWNYARENGCSIISKDSDFHQMSFLFGAPPKTIWLRCGNCSTTMLESIIRRNSRKIAKFLEDDESALLVIDR